jgi:hypothetical protein
MLTGGLAAGIATRSFTGSVRLRVYNAFRTKCKLQTTSDRFDGLVKYPVCAAYVAQATARPAFAKALADQMVHFPAGLAAV